MTAPVIFGTTTPQPVVAQQFVDENTSMSICSLYSVTITYNQSDGQKTVMARVGTPNASYLMNNGDWMVLGPNIEGVYSDAAYHALFQTAAANEVVPYVSPAFGDSMSATLALYASAATTATVDWGDGSDPDTDVAVGNDSAPVKLNHTYDEASRYAIKITGADTPPVTCYFQSVLAATSANLASTGEVAPANDGGVTTTLGSDVQMDPDYPQIDDTGTYAERISSGSPTTAAQLSTIDEADFGTWTPEQMARIEAGLPPDESSTSEPSGVV